MEDFRDLSDLCNSQGCRNDADGPWGEYCSDCIRERGVREERELRRLERDYEVIV